MPTWPSQRLLDEALLQVPELALGAAAIEGAVLDRGDAGGVITAIFEPAQRVDQIAGDRLVPQNSDDAAHGRFPAFTFRTVTGTRTFTNASSKHGLQFTVCFLIFLAISQAVFLRFCIKSLNFAAQPGRSSWATALQRQGARGYILGNYAA